MIKINKTTMNYVTEQLGIVEMPQIGWVIDGDGRNETQKSYHLQIAKDKAFTTLVYDSNEMLSEQSAHIVPKGFKLESMTKYFIRVKVEMADGQRSEWGETVYFLTALCKNEWEAQFISADSEDDAEESKGTYVRKEFVVDKEISEAYISTTALGLYELYFNGKRVGTDELTPGFTSYNKHLLYQTYEVTELLKQGPNAIGAMLGVGWFKGKICFIEQSNSYGNRSAFLGQLVIKYKDGSVETIITDNTWQGNDSPVVFADIYNGEVYDASKEIPGWSEAGLSTDTWRTVDVIPRDMSILRAQSTTKIKEIEPMKAKRIFKTPQGDTVIDFGQNLTGWIHIKTSGKKGDEVQLDCFEVLDKDGNVYLDNLRGAREQIHYIFGGDGEIEYHPSFTFMGFQFVKISKYPGEPKLEDFTAYTVHSDMGDTGTFECSNADVNQLQSNIRWGMKGNFLDVPTDCPQRNERMGWTGDAQIFCRTASYLMNTYNFFRKWLHDVAVDQTSEGGVPHIVPDMLGEREIDDWLLSQGTHSATAWADAAVIMPWVVYQTFGDTEILKLQYDSMKGWIDFMCNHAEDYMWSYKMQFGDWVALDAEEGSYLGATPNDLVCNAYFAYSTELFVKACKAIGKDEEAKKYGEIYDKIVAKYQKTFFTDDGKMTAQTQTAHIVSLYFGLVPEKYKATVIEGLKGLLAKENGHLVTGFVGTPYFCHALSENGCTDEAYELLLKDDFPSWLYQVKMGATTIWEHWDGIKPDGSMWSADMNSFNHYAYGAVGEWLYRVCAGIEIDDEQPGYKHTILQPHIGGGLSYAQGEFDSIYGKIKSRWAVAGEVVTLDCTIPVNTTATIYLDQCKKVIAADGLDFTEANGVFQAKAGSGSYQIQYKR